MDDDDFKGFLTSCLLTDMMVTFGSLPCQSIMSIVRIGDIFSYGE